MKTIYPFIAVISLFIEGTAFSQSTMQLKFTAMQTDQHITLDSICIQNMTGGGDTMLYWPDTVLNLMTVDIHNFLETDDGFELVQQSPNPSTGNVEFKVVMPGNGMLTVIISDITGRKIALFSESMGLGAHNFIFRPSSGRFYLINARWRDQVRSMKVMVMKEEYSGNGELRYSGSIANTSVFKSNASLNSFGIVAGDILRCVGFKDTLVGVLRASAINNSTNVISFGLNAPCPGISSIIYGGKEYATVKIGTKCWMAENLNIGIFTVSNNTGASHSDVSNNGVIEKYCYNNDSINCTIYGGLYDWDEMMGYVITAGVQGICPLGWHIPTDNEWCSLTIYLDPAVDCSSYSSLGWSGTNAGLKMRETGINHWYSPNTGANNSSGFTALGNGGRRHYGNFINLMTVATFWSSSEYPYYSPYAYNRALENIGLGINRYTFPKTHGFSVRCIKNL